MNSVALRSLFALAGFAAVAQLSAQIVDGQPQMQVTDQGAYRTVLSPANSSTIAGNPFRFLFDDPAYTVPTGTWLGLNNVPNTQLAFSFADSASVETFSTFGSVADYDYSSAATTSGATTPLLVTNYSMSNNFDLTIASGFTIAQDVEIGEITAYFRPETIDLSDTGVFFNPMSDLVRYRMNLYSAMDMGGMLVPTASSFVGDVFSAEFMGTDFNVWADAFVTGTDFGNATDDLWAITYTLDNPFTLAAGTYFFSHDAIIIPEPAALATFGIVGLFALVLVRRLRR